MRKLAFFIILIFLVGVVIVVSLSPFQNNPNHSKETTHPITHETRSPTNTPSEEKSLEHAVPICPPSIWGYGYVYPNETITLLIYPSIDYLKNSSLVRVRLGSFTILYKTQVLLSMINSSGVKGRVPLPIYLKFSSPGKQIGITGDTPVVQLWKDQAIINESRLEAWLYFQIASIKPQDVRLKFGKYSSLYTSFKKGPDTFEYMLTITNLYDKPVVIQNVSFPLRDIQEYPAPPDIKVLSFKLIEPNSNRTLKVLSPNSTATLKTLIEVPSNVSGLYFKPKLMIQVGTEKIFVPAPPMEYIRVKDCR